MDFYEAVNFHPNNIIANPSKRKRAIIINRVIKFFLENKLIAALLFFAMAGWGIATAPFDWDIDIIPRDPVPVDAIPDIGENQQIVFTEWPGQSPRDIEDQVTYPLTTQLLGIPGVQTIRSNSMFGFSSINVIFEEGVAFYWSRARILEKLNALPRDLLPAGVQPALGPDATALGQIFWYTLEGKDPDGNPTGGWDLQELRSIQDFQVRFALAAVDGVAEVASIGGFVKEYQVDIDPDAMAEAGVTVAQIANAVRKSNQDVGARTIEMSRVEYLVRGLGYITSIKDIEDSVVDVVDNIPIRIQDVAKVSMGPAQRRGALDKAGAEAVGGVVVARYGENPLEVIDNVKAEIENIAPGLPERELADGTLSRVTIEPFYDRSGLIYETLGTLEEALSLQILITILVIIVMVMHLRSSALISALLPLAVLMSFIMMRYAGVEANVVALAGIAISIGTVVDMGIILTENILRHMDDAWPEESRLGVVYRAVSEVSPAVITALTTTIVSFLPVFMLEAQEGRMFGPLAFTKTFILIAALIIVLTIIPAFAHWLFTQNIARMRWRLFWNFVLVAGGAYVALFFLAWAGFTLMFLGISNLAAAWFTRYKPYALYVNNAVIMLGVAWLLAGNWLPLGPENPISASLVFILLIVAILFALFRTFMHYYRRILGWVIRHRKKSLAVPIVLFIAAATVWQGYDTMFRFISRTTETAGIDITETRLWQSMEAHFPGFRTEFMPTLDEGSFLLMPTTMPHAGIEEALEMMRDMDTRIASIPEVETVVGKIGRVESALDPAPLSMFENVILYKSEYKSDERGRRIRFRVDDQGNFVKDESGDLIPDRTGRYYRQWRDEISSTDDIWHEISAASDLPGVTSAPRLQPIETRLVMLQTGMRGNMGVRVSGPDLETIDTFITGLADHIRAVPSVRGPSVFADRVVGKPYLEIDIDRESIARHGLTIADVQDVISTAIGGKTQTMTVEKRERYPVRVRYPREYRDSPETMARILLRTPGGERIPLGQLADFNFETGPMNIRSENTFLSAYVTFDHLAGETPVEVVDAVRAHLDDQIDRGNLVIPDGVSYVFEGEYKHHLRASERLSIVVPITLLIIFLLIYFQFRSTPVSLIIFSGIALAWSGGFLMLWLYGQEWFMNVDIRGVNVRDLFQMGPINMSVAVWVGFLALFGISVDNGVVQATYLNQRFLKDAPDSTEKIRQTAIEAGMRRVRPCLMTTATTLLALMPILTSPGKGSEIMLPMAVPIFGGMFVQILNLLLVPTLYAMVMERKAGRPEKRDNRL